MVLGVTDSHSMSERIKDTKPVDSDKLTLSGDVARLAGDASSLIVAVQSINS